MPLIGGDKPVKDEPPKAAAPPPTSAAVPVRLSSNGSKATPPDERVTDRVLAIVNNDAITLSEIQEAIAVYKYENRDRATESSDQLIQQFLTRMIDSRLQVQEAEREKIVIDEAEIDEELADRIKKMNMKNREEFEAALKAQGIPMAAIRKRIADELRRGRIVSRKVRLRISVTEDEVSQYLEANRPKLETGLGYHARHILVLPETGAEDAAWENARIRAELLSDSAAAGRRLRRAGEAVFARRERPGRRRSRNAQARRARAGHRDPDPEPVTRTDLVSVSLRARLSHLPTRIQGDPRGRGAGPRPGSDPRDSLPRKIRHAARRVAQGDQTARRHRRAPGWTTLKSIDNRVAGWQACSGVSFPTPQKT
jgi:hypothetical protein